MVDAGFYYKGSGDRVLCFYCGGGLFYWKPHDNPWYEHAKWFPMCEFVLKKQGEKLCGESMSETFGFASTRHKKSNSNHCSEPLM